MMRKSSTRAPSGRNAWARTPASLGIEIFFADLGYELLQTTHEGLLAKGSMHFLESGSGVLCQPIARILGNSWYR